MITPIRLALVCFLLAFVPLAKPAQACSCGQLSAKGYMAAERVFIAKALPIHKVGVGTAQRLRILHTLKGPRAKFFDIKRRHGIGMCSANFRPGAVSIVFARGSKALSTCSGNWGFASMQRMYGALFKLGKPRTGVPDKAGFKLALSKALKPYLHKRKRMVVVYAALNGTTITIGRTRLRFMGKSTAKTAVRITDAVTSGPIQFVRGTFAAEGLSFAVLVHRPKLKVLNSFAVER